MNFNDPFGLCPPKDNEPCHDQTAAEGKALVGRAQAENVTIAEQGIVYGQQRKGSGTMDCSQYVCKALGHPHAAGANDLTTETITSDRSLFRPLGAGEAPQVGDILYQPNASGGHVGIFTGERNKNGGLIGCAMGGKSGGSCSSVWGIPPAKGVSGAGWFAGSDKLTIYRPQIPNK